MRILKFIFLIFLLFFSCEKSFKYSEKKDKNFTNIYLDIENLVGNLTIYGGNKYLCEIKKVGLMGNISTNFNQKDFYINLINFTGESEIFLDKKKNIYIKSLISGGSLKLSSKMKVEELFCEMNSGYLYIDNASIKKIVITNNFGDIKIKIGKSNPVRLKLSSFVSYLNIPESFVMSNDYFYYLNEEEGLIDMDIYVNMGKLEILF
ncbi:MAG: hypothetical protein ACP5Q5_06995 [Brevinematia bacterium]